MADQGLRHVTVMGDRGVVAAVDITDTSKVDLLGDGVVQVVHTEGTLVFAAGQWTMIQIGLPNG